MLYRYNIPSVDHHFVVESSRLISSHKLELCSKCHHLQIIILLTGHGYIVLKIDCKSDKVRMDHRQGIYFNVSNPTRGIVTNIWSTPSIPSSNLS
jgi:hypothetical protein